MPQRFPIRAFVIPWIATSCGAAKVDAPQPEMQPSVVASTHASSSAGAVVAPPAWYSAEPIDTAAPQAAGCVVSARQARLALSVDGSPEGVFLAGVSGASGELVIQPGGESAARAKLGVAEFDTRLDLSQTTFMLRNRPLPVGGILHLEEAAPVRVTGGDKDRLRVEPVDAVPETIAWTSSPAFEVPCDGLNHSQRWSAPAASQEAQRTVYAQRLPIAVRAERAGPVVATIRVGHAGVLSSSGKDLLLKVWLPGLGTVVGWTEAQDWTDTRPPQAARSDLGGSGMGRMMHRKVECPTGTRLYVRQRNRLYAVGYIRVPVPRANREEWDWRVAGDRIRLESSGNLPDGVAWIGLTDEFRITNRFWHDGVRDAFVVPFGPGGCSWEQAADAQGRRLGSIE